jgi:hypothetical protein
MAVSVLKALGPGCPRCCETHRVVRHVVDEAKVSCLVQESESVERILSLVVMATALCGVFAA